MPIIYLGNGHLKLDNEDKGELQIRTRYIFCSVEAYFLEQLLQTLFILPLKPKKKSHTQQLHIYYK